VTFCADQAKAGSLFYHRESEEVQWTFRIKVDISNKNTIVQQKYLSRTKMSLVATSALDHQRFQLLAICSIIDFTQSNLF